MERAFHWHQLPDVYYHKDVAEQCTIPPLTPLVIMHPLTDKKVIIKNHLVSESEYDRMFGLGKLLLKRNGKEWSKFYTSKQKLKSKSLNKSSFSASALHGPDPSALKLSSSLTKERFQPAY